MNELIVCICSRHRRSITGAVVTSFHPAKRSWITHIFIFLVCVSTKILAGLILSKASPPRWRKIFHTWRRGSQDTGPTESLSRSALPIFHRLSTSTSHHYLFFFVFEQSANVSQVTQQTDSDGRKPASGETAPVAARKRSIVVTNSGQSKKCPGCWANGVSQPQPTPSAAGKLLAAARPALLLNYARGSPRWPWGRVWLQVIVWGRVLSERHSTHTSVNSFRLVAGLKTSRRPITCSGRERGRGGAWPPEARTNQRESTGNRLRFSAHIFVFHVLEQPQLSVRPLGVDDGLKGPRQLLDSDLQAGLQIICRTVREINESIAAVPSKSIKFHRYEDISINLCKISSHRTKF